jgi:hypothetical protein
MVTLEYEEIDPVSRSEAEAIFRSDDPVMIARTLISFGLYDHDWKWVQQHGLRFLSDDNEVVVSAAILSLANTAKANRSIDRDVVVPALQKVANNQRYKGKVQDAIDDIEMFVKRR